MESTFRYVAPPAPCSYLPAQTARLEYELMGTLAASEYMELMLQGWRRFGHMIFRPHCQTCRACQALRVPTVSFAPNRSQRRCRTSNEGSVKLRIGKPNVTPQKLALYDRFHAFMADHRGWRDHEAKDAREYADSFVNNPFPTEEWCYYVGPRLVGVGYVDVLPGGLSAIYFYHEPDERPRSLGVWNVLNVLEQATRRRLPHVYLGYYVEGCASLEYKANYAPNEVLRGGVWQPFRA